MHQTQTPHSRRRFLKQTAAASSLIGLSRSSILGDDAPSRRIRVGVIGLGRGMAHVSNAIAIPGVELGYICDIDANRLQSALKSIEERKAPPPKAVQDFRHVLDDPTIDAVMIATCNHWHAPLAILACAAGKDVYVEKPGSHNAREAQLLVAAARKYERIVQMGNQRRTWPAIREAMERLHNGDIGHVTYARSWYNNARGSIGKGNHVPAPSHLNYDLWQGPAPERPYKDNLVHYNWHWHWHWGNGELGNNGIHALDLVRWGLDVEFPKTISYTGGRYHYQDDQETPDTAIATYDFGGKGASWDGSSCHPRREEKKPFVRFYGTGGSLAIEGAGYAIYDLDGKLTHSQTGPGGDRDHMSNFFDCIRSRHTPNAEIEIGQRSTLLCHLGNMAYRTGQTLHFDASSQHIVGSPEAQALWGREYRSGWDPVV